MKILLNNFLTVKTEWPTVWAPKIFFDDVKIQDILSKKKIGV